MWDHDIILCLFFFSVAARRRWPSPTPSMAVAVLREAGDGRIHTGEVVAAAVEDPAPPCWDGRIRNEEVVPAAVEDPCLLCWDVVAAPCRGRLWLHSATPGRGRRWGEEPAGEGTVAGEEGQGGAEECRRRWQTSRSDWGGAEEGRATRREATTGSVRRL
jgi:hypothetical protein